jgi:hypothetical protein
MQDRRHSARDKVLLGAVTRTNGLGATVNCVVRNFSEDGACIELEAPATLPEEIHLTIARKGRSYLARIVWQHDNRIGLALRPMSAEPLPRDVATRLRQSEKKKRELQRRVNELLGED